MAMAKLEEDLEFLLSVVTSALDKAERNAVPSKLDELYIEEVREIVYDAEDALLDCRTKKLQDQMEGAGTTTCGHCWSKKRPREVSDQVPSPPPSPIIPCSSCTGEKLQKLQDKWASIMKRRNYLSIEKVGQRNLGSSVTARRPPTGSMITQRHIYSMQEIKDGLVELLSSDSDSTTREESIDDDFKEASCRNLTILPIPGVGQSGKTTLAQHVFNDARIQQMFSPKGWVCASNHQGDNPVEFMKSVLESIGHLTASDVLNTVQDLLINELEGKKFLLVIDDARNQSLKFWSTFCTLKLAESVAEGSTIIITTPEYEVLDVLPKHVRRTRPCYLSSLPFEDCMSLFESRLASPEVLKDEKILRICKQIVKKYEGIPGAIRDAADSLRCKEDASEWEEVLARASSDSCWVTSYQELGFQLRRCFMYCALFPKGYPFTRERLINMWMSEGFLQPKGNKRMEDLGNKYFNELVHKFILQEKKNKEHEMPNPLHDLAETILDQNLCRFNDRDEVTRGEKTEHARYTSLIVDRPKDIVKFKAPNASLRDYIILNTSDSLLQLNLPDSAFSKLGYLRTLDLSYTNLVELPTSICQLRSLHFLGLNSTLIEALPESLGMLYNLQTLQLNSCRKFKALPKSISNLIQLRYLSLDGTLIEVLPEEPLGMLSNLQTLGLKSCAKLKNLPKSISNLIQLRHLRLDVHLTDFCMPAGLSRLTNLQTLPVFNVGSSDEDARLQELQGLKNLRGKLFIRGLCNARTEDLRSPILKELKFLEDLTFCWPKDWVLDYNEANGKQHKPDEHHQPLFVNLKPHTKLQNLSVQFYGGKKLPEWMQCTSFKELKYVQLKECKNCDTLPSLGQLPSLKYLTIYNVGVDVIDSRFGTFPLLEDLTLEDMFKWEKWSVANELTFPKLKLLHLANCPLLASVPEIKHLKKKLKMENCSSVTEISNLASLVKLTVRNCKQLTTISSLTSLKKLKLVNCGELTRLCSFPCSEESVTSLEKLTMENCDKLTTFSSYPRLKRLEMLNCLALTKIPSLPSLKMLRMDNCSKVERIPDFPHLEMMDIRGCKDLIEFTSLMTLQNHDISKVDKLHAVHVPMSLQVLILKSCNESIEWGKGYESENDDLSKLKVVDFFNCSDFGHLRKISSVTLLKLEKCKSKFDFSRFPSLKYLHIYDCDELDELPTLGFLSSLTIMYCGRLRICDQPELRDLWVESCNQIDIGMLGRLDSLFIANSQFHIKPQAWLQSKNFVRENYITSFTKDGTT